MASEKEELAAKSIKSVDNESYDWTTEPPDGGYGWVILVACFVSSFTFSLFDLRLDIFLFPPFKLVGLIVDGFLYSFGAISNNLKEHYKCQEWAVSLIISLACGSSWLSGK